MVSQQTDSLFPEETGPPPGGPTLPATVNTRVCPLYQLGSAAAAETVCPLQSLQSDKPPGPLLAALLGLHPSYSGIRIWGLGWPGLEPEHLIQGLGG